MKSLGVSIRKPLDSNSRPKPIPIGPKPIAPIEIKPTSWTSLAGLPLDLESWDGMLVESTTGNMEIGSSSSRDVVETDSKQARINFLDSLISDNKEVLRVLLLNLLRCAQTTN